jgi:hypothetical protein
MREMRNSYKKYMKGRDHVGDLSLVERVISKIS